MIVLAVDPGKITGVALLTANGSEINAEWSVELEWLQSIDRVNATLNEHRDALEVVCEDYVVTQATAKKTQAPWSLEGIGACRWLAYKYDASFTTYTADLAKNFCPNERLKELGIWHRGGAGHARDALRIGVYHAVNIGWRSPKLLG